MLYERNILAKFVGCSDEISHVGYPWISPDEARRFSSDVISPGEAHRLSLDVINPDMFLC